MMRSGFLSYRKEAKNCGVFEEANSTRGTDLPFGAVSESLDWKPRGVQRIGREDETIR
jgi:hypothetical protein